MAAKRVRRGRIKGVRSLEVLLGSRTRAALLTAFSTQPAEDFYARQLARETGLALASVQLELSKLERLGLVTPRRRGREKLYRVVERHPFFPELKRLVYKSTAIGEPLRRALAGAEGIDAAFIYGSVAKGNERVTSDIDLFILGKPDQTKLASGLREAEKRLDREINLTVMGSNEWWRRSAAGEGFIKELLDTDKIFLIGDEDALRSDRR